MKTLQRMSQRLAAITRESLSDHVVLRAPVTFSVAASANVRLDAARLVGKLYSAEGYLGEEHVDGAPFLTPHHLLPEATVFIAREGKRVIGTLTVILDSAAGLPMESLYGEEVAQLRASGRRVCEICSLAIDPQRENGSSTLVLNLFKRAMTYLVHLTDVSDALITLKPSHAAFYGRRLNFVSMGELKFDTRFGNAETVAMRMSREYYNLAAAIKLPSSQRERLLADFFATPSAAELDTLKQELALKARCTDEFCAHVNDRKVGMAMAMNSPNSLAKSQSSHGNNIDASISGLTAAVYTMR
jgi:hypothetical protein